MVAKKMNNLRSAFRKEHKKDISSLRSGASADDVYQPSVWYYEQLLFLQDQETPRQSVTNVMIMFAHHALLQEHLRQLEQVEEVRIPRVIPRDRANPFRYHTEEDFVKRYRLPKNAVQDLIEAIEPHAPRPNNDRGYHDLKLKIILSIMLMKDELVIGWRMLEACRMSAIPSRNPPRHHSDLAGGHRDQWCQ
ncbi:hypothetical protein Pcinc_014598 [Petrolisthes cinctipes]|uniref:MADF domain-containing protein n=1 Tax=Petrolisthes cinctipes TaxID=88211 RepID=A0AAE1FUM2_PETCI|nr:hypothetical protein Pcinc_014598 [Petrolisthes cinctipes]